MNASLAALDSRFRGSTTLAESAPQFLCLKYEKGGRAEARPPQFRRSEGAYAATLIFSAATATRFEIGWATSPASFSIASVFFDVWATTESNAERT